MQIGMKIFVIACCLFHIITALSSASPVPVKNPYFQTGKRGLVTTTSKGSPSSTIRNYKFPFTGVIPPLFRVQYTTCDIDAQTYSHTHPSDNNLHFIEYDIVYDSHSSTHLSTNIAGYFQNPFILSITIMYILIFQNNPFINDYIIFRQIHFSNGYSSYPWTSVPNKYSQGNYINYACMFKSLAIYYFKNDLPSNDFEIYYDLSCSFYNNYWYQEVLTSLYLSWAIYNNNYRISMLLIIVDSTAVSNDFPNYKVRAGIQYSSSSYLTVNTWNDITQLQINFIGGFTGIYYYHQKEPSFKLSFYNTSNGFQVQFHGSTSRHSNNNYYMRYSYFLIAYYECPKGYYVYHSGPNLCYDGCNSGEYYNPKSQKCQLCSDYCNDCNTFNQCLSCESSQNRQLRDYTCVPKDGYYQTNTLIAAPCTNPCLHCSLSPTNCTKCTGFNRALSNFRCELCSDLFHKCQKCVENECLQCETDHFLLNNTFCKHTCEAGCIQCNNYIHTNCILCMTGYSLVFGKCVVLLNCGDGYVDPSEECDDGAFVAKDGCSPYCTIENGYQCPFIIDPTGAKVTTHCAFLNTIDFTVISQQKMEYSNQMEIFISIQHFNQLFWNNIDDLSPFFKLSNLSYRNLKLKFVERNTNSMIHLQPRLKQKYKPSSLMVLTFEYLQSINKQKITLSFDFSKATNLTLSKIPLSSKNIVLIPDNGRIAQVYSNDTYLKTALLAQIFQLTSFTLLLYFTLSYFVTGRMLVAELLMVFQIAYVSVLAQPQLGPYSVSLTHLRPIFSPISPNALFNIRPFEDAMTTPQIKGMQLFSQFIYNFNIGSAFIVIPFILAIFASIYSCLVQNQQKIIFWKNISQRFVTECVFAGLMYAGCIVGVSTVLQSTVGITEHKSILGLASIVEMGILGLLYIIYGILRVAKRRLFGQAETMLLQDANHSMAFQILLFYSGITIGSLLTLYGDWKWINTTIAAFFILLYIFTLGKQMFRSNKDRYRTQLNLLTIALTQTPFIYNRFYSNKEYINDSDASLMIPAFVAVILLLNFVINSSYFVYLIIKKVRQWCAENESSKKIGLQVFDMSTPITDLGKPKFRKGFIEYSEGSDPQLQIDIPKRMNGQTSFQKHSPPLNQFLNTMETTHPLRNNALNSQI